MTMLRRGVLTTSLVAFLAACTADNLDIAALSGSRPDKPLIETDWVADLRAAPPWQPSASEGVRGLATLATETMDIPLSSEELETYLHGIAERLLANWGPQVPDIDIVVTSSPRYSAYTQPDNVLYVDIGLIENADSEDEIAGVLAHELAHLLLHHFKQDEIAAQRRKLTTGVMAGASVAAELVAAYGGNEKAEAATDVAKIALLSELVAENALDPGWTRIQEEQADLLAVDLVTAAGYAPDVMIHVMQRLSYQDSSRKTRLDALAEAYQGRIDEAISQGRLDASFQMGFEMMQNSIKAGIADLFDRVRQRHPDAESRNKVIREYIVDHYITIAQPAPDRQSLDRLRQGTRAERDRVLSAHRALLAAEVGNQDRARKLARQALNGPKDPNPQARYALYVVERDQGRHERALLHLELARNHPQAPTRIMEILAAEYAARGRHSDALAVLDEAERRYGRPVALMPARIGVLKSAGRVEEARQVLSTCEAQGNSHQVKACRAVANGTPTRPSDRHLPPAGGTCLPSSLFPGSGARGTKPFNAAAIPSPACRSHSVPCASFAPAALP